MKVSVCTVGEARCKLPVARSIADHFCAIPQPKWDEYVAETWIWQQESASGAE